MVQEMTINDEKKIIESIDGLIIDARLDEALELNIRIYEEALANDRTTIVAYCLYFFGLIEDTKAQPQKAMAFFKKATAISRRNGIYGCLVRTLNNRGNIYYFTGKLHKAIAKYMEALNIAEENKELEEYQVKLLNNLGLVYIDVEDYDHALDYMFRCMKMAKTRDDDILLTTVYANLSDIFILKENYLKASYYNQLSQEISRRIDDQIGVAISYANEAIIINRTKNDWKTAKQLFEEAIYTMEQGNGEADKEEILLKYGSECYRAQGGIQAVAILEELVEVSRQKTYFSIESKALKVLKEIYASLGQYQKAYQVCDRLLSVNESTYMQWKETAIDKIHKDNDDADDSQINELQKSIKTLKHLSDIGQKITSCKNEDEIYGVLEENMARIFGYDAFGLGVLSKNGIKIDYKFLDDEGYRNMDISIYDDDYLMATCIRYGQDIIVYDTKDHTYNEANFTGKLLYKIKQSDTRGIIFTPMIYEGETIGGLTVQTYERGKLTYVDMESLRVLASYTAIAYSNLSRSRELQVANRKLAEVSLMDGLTGVYNRHALGQYIGKEFIGLLENKLPSTAIMIDIDYFKQYNDNYGHFMGDKCLKQVCASLRNSLSGIKHRLFRYGGDEFFAVLEGCDEKQAKSVLEKIQFEMKQLNIEHLYSKIEKRVTLTIGATVITKKIKDYTVVFNNSDEALYEAKENGRNSFSINITT